MQGATCGRGVRAQVVVLKVPNPWPLLGWILPVVLPKLSGPIVTRGGMGLCRHIKACLGLICLEQRNRDVIMSMDLRVADYPKVLT